MALHRTYADYHYQLQFASLQAPTAESTNQATKLNARGLTFLNLSYWISTKTGRLLVAWDRPETDTG